MKRFARLRLLLGMAALLGAAAAAVLLASPYAPVVEPCRDIEDIWAIEDAREESDTPLVTALDNNGQALGYDAASNTFYCTLGLGHEEDWPQLHLTAPGANGVSLCFVDDYTYDWCADAIRDGWAYQILAYTDDAYSYASLVFTGLPIISLETQEALRPHEDIPVRVSVSAAGEAGLTACGRAHERGDTSLRMRPKHGIKVEFTRHADGTRKTEQEMPLLGRTDEFILIACSMDYLLIRDKLSWDLWNGISSEDEAFGPRETAYCEVFAGDAYLGVYVMMKPYDYAQELARLGADAPAADSLYRLAGRSVHEFDKPLIQDHRGMYYEQHYIWAHSQGGQTRYRFAFWDMDLTWGLYAGDEGDRWVELPVADRVIALDVGGARSRIGEIWADLQRRGVTEETIDALVTQYVHELGDSGAYARDAQRWEKGGFVPDGYEIVGFASARFEMMNAWVNALGE